jgi:hypothetical protein
VRQVGRVARNAALATAVIGAFRLVSAAAPRQVTPDGVPCRHAGPIVRAVNVLARVVEGEALEPGLLHAGVDLPAPSVRTSVEVRVDESGKATSACGAAGVSPQIQALLIAAAMRLHFHPAIQSGQPVPSVAVLGYEAGHDRAAYEEIRRSSDVAWLTRIADSESYAHDLERRIVGLKSRYLRTTAYVRLGDLGSDDALAGIGRIERRLRQLHIDRPLIDIEVWPAAAQATADWLATALVDSDGPNGIRYRVFVRLLFGQPDLFVAWSRTPADRSSWSRPRLIDAGFRPGVADEGQIEWLNDATAVLRFRERAWDGNSPDIRRREVRLSLPDIVRDTDGDGWTDAEERRLGLNPLNGDTDGDKSGDGVDTCPLLARTRTNNASDEAQIVQRAFLATFGFSDAREILRVVSSAPQVHLFGYPGPILFGGNVDDANRFFSEEVSWTISSRTASSAEIEVAGRSFGNRWVLRRFKAGWFVVHGGVGWVE